MLKYHYRAAARISAPAGVLAAGVHTHARPKVDVNLFSYQSAQIEDHTRDFSGFLVALPRNRSPQLKVRGSDQTVSLPMPAAWLLSPSENG
jgi:hypothetical protein